MSQCAATRRPDPALANDTEPTAAKSRLNRAAWRGSTLTAAGTGLSSVIRLGANLIITRLLLPEHFGLMALVSVFLVGLSLFSDIGLGLSIIQNPRGEEPKFYNTVWTLAVLRGGLLWLAACAIALPAARIYDQAQLGALLPVAGLTALVNGFESTRVSILNRRFAFVRITILDLLTQLIGVAAMIGLALVWRSVWSLVLSTVLSAFARTLISHLALGGPRNRFAWDPEARRSILKFGRWIFISTAITFLASQSDRLLLGKLVPPDQLGFYSIAANLAAMPIQFVAKLGQAVFFPIIAEAMRQPDHNPASIRRSRVNLLLVMVPVMALGVALSPPVVRLVYTPTFHPVGPLASFLFIGTWLTVVSTSYGVVLLAGGRPKLMSLGQLLKAILALTSIGMVAPRFGVAGVAVVISLAEIGLIIGGMIGCYRYKIVTVFQDLGITAGGVALTAAFYLTHDLLLRMTGTPILALGVVSLLGLACSGIVARRVGLF